MLTNNEKEYMARELESRIKEYVGINIYKSCLNAMNQIDISNEDIGDLTINYKLNWPCDEMRRILKSYKNGKGIANPLSLPKGGS